MRTIRCFCAAIFFAASSLLTPSWATSFTTDQSDLWWIPTESGWGIQLVQRGGVIFATMFVYDPTRIPIWYTATITPQVTPFTWSGDLYLTNGPWFGTVPFNPATVTLRKVGTLTWTGVTVTTGTLTYSVDGVVVTKSVTRQLLVYDDFSGRYAGASHSTFTGCSNPLNNGTGEALSVFAVAQTGTAVTVTTSGGDVCTYSGTLTQAGQMGRISGTYTCASGDFGSFVIFETQVNISGITGRFNVTSTPTGCTGTGWFGGMRATTF